MYPRRFEYAAPATLDDAIHLLVTNDDVKILAGGQSLIPLLKLRLVSPRLLVDVAGIADLDGIGTDGDRLVIGPMVTHNRLASDPTVRRLAPALAEAAAVVGDPQVRNRGTIGGSLCHGDAVGDEAAAVIVLGCDLILAGPKSRRTVPAADFFIDTLSTAAGPSEVLVGISVPVHRDARSTYRKIGRRGAGRDYPVVGVAGWRSAGGEMRLALTGASTKPCALPGASAAAGADRNDCGPVAAGEVPVIGDLYGSADYKRHLVAVMVDRVVRTLKSD